MASAYLLAKDKLEQARAILMAEAWFDPEADHLFELAIRRLIELDNLASTGLVGPRPERPHNALALMPWLDR
ncbi:hypothetical protein [Pelagibacterium limicola]|uniref:hypothetical protein n=1 Tax=Pelagibacterium limicola TaxID=2791022 RepID=UPI0018AFA1DA|nr:hypothetical protein [Pelagibacterium limicola]